ncbi:MAG: YadA C-terminal domain-containing protein [Sphingomonadales bacterium]|nr:YadA C-terminal domain-containing protein [Sphingomonadales bacterium]
MDRARGAQAFGWQIQRHSSGHRRRRRRSSGKVRLRVRYQAAAAGTRTNAVGDLNGYRGNSTGGAGATTAFAGATAIGTGATTTRANQVVLGGTGSSVTVGDLTASTAAQTGPVSIVTADAGGTLGRSTINLTQLGALPGQVNTLFNLTEINRRDIRKANEGVAMALALDSPSVPAGANFAVSGGIGYYQNRTAATTAFSARVSDKAIISAGVGVGLNSGEVGARGGFQFAW